MKTISRKFLNENCMRKIDQFFRNFLNFMKVPDVKYVFHCPDANKEHVIMLWNVIVRNNGLVLIVKYVRFFFAKFAWKCR